MELYIWSVLVTGVGEWETIAGHEDAEWLSLSWHSEFTLGGFVKVVVIAHDRQGSEDQR